MVRKKSAGVCKLFPKDILSKLVTRVVKISGPKNSKFSGFFEVMESGVEGEKACR